jgi:HSP20 family protein
MTLSEPDPTRDMNLLQERMNKLFEESLRRGRTTEQEYPMGSWMPAVDIYETEDRIVLKADLPGVEQEEIDLRIEDNTLILRGERKFAHEERKEDFLRIERTYGSFQRTFRLPSTVDQSRVKATHDDGVLQVVLLKKENSRPQAIKVDIKQS